MLKIYIIIGSTREGRRSESVAKWVYSLAQKRKDLEVELVDLRDWPLPFYNQKEGGPRMVADKMSEPLANKWRDKIAEADGFIIVTPEYNHGYPAVLKNALDYTYSPWNNKPVGFVSYGSTGGAKGVEQLRLVAIELQMAPVHTAIHLMRIRELFDEKGQMKENYYNQNVEDLLDQMKLWGDALKEVRKSLKSS